MINSYDCDIDISSLITLEDAIDTFGLGPNGGNLVLSYLSKKKKKKKKKKEKLKLIHNYIIIYIYIFNNINYINYITKIKKFY